METKPNHGGLLSFEPTFKLNKWGFIAKTWNDRIYPPFYHPGRIDELIHFWEPDNKDIFICTHQKVGTHLTKKYVVELLRHFLFHAPEHGITTGDIGHGTVPWPEVSVSQYGMDAFREKLHRDRDVPRLWYTHCSLDDLPFHVNHNKSNFIHVFRDPRGVVVSQYHFYRYHPMLGVSQDLDMDSFIDLFLEGRLYFGDYFEHTSRWMRTAAGKPDMGRVISVRYEDLVERKTESILKFCNFLFPGLSLTDEKAASIAEATEFDKMKKEISENPQTFHFNPDKFFREGKSRGWEESLSREQQARICSVASEKWAGVETGYEFETA